jgi:ribonuclease E
VLRSLEDQLLKGVTHNLIIRTRTVVALYILTQKRATLAEIEQRFGLTVTVAADETISNGAHFVIERGEPVEARPVQPASITPASVSPDVAEADETVDEALAEEEEAIEEIADDEEAGDGDFERHGEQREDGEGGRRRRRRRGRRGGGERRPENGQRPQPQAAAGEPQQSYAGDEPAAEGEPRENAEGFGGPQLGPDGQPRKRRRGRRGGRRGRRGREGGPNAQPAEFGQQPAAEAQHPYQPGNFARRSEFDEIDTTPTLESRPSFEAPRPIDLMRDTPPDEIDTTPQPETRVERVASAEPESEPATAPEPAAPRAEEPVEDASRPKRSGWWQRKSFF